MRLGNICYLDMRGVAGLVNKLLEKKSYNAHGGRSANINNLLPVEILHKILLLLSHRDLKVGHLDFKKFRLNIFVRWRCWSVNGGSKLGRRKVFGPRFLSESTQGTWL